MNPKELFDFEGRKLFNCSGPVSQLGLDGLVLPMLPDLCLMLYDPFIGRLITESQMLQEDILHLAFAYEPVFADKYGIIKKGEFPFQVPSGSAHLIEGHKKKLAQGLIYACSIDIKDDKPYFDLELLEETVGNAIAVAEENDMRTLGIPSLMSPMFDKEYQMKEIINATAETAAKRLEYAANEGTSLQEIYVLSLPEEFNTAVTPIGSESRN